MSQTDVHKGNPEICSECCRDCRNDYFSDGSFCYEGPRQNGCMMYDPFDEE